MVLLGIVIKKWRGRGYKLHCDVTVIKGMVNKIIQHRRLKKSNVFVHKFLHLLRLYSFFFWLSSLESETRH